MERITLLAKKTTKTSGQIRLRFRLRDGRAIDLSHKSEIQADLKELSKFNDDGTLRPGTKVFNAELLKQIANEIDAMKRAYNAMKQEGYDLTSEVLEKMVFQELHPIQAERTKQSTLLERLETYVSTSYENGLFGNSRLKHYKILLQELQRFLTINGKTAITPNDFTANDVMSFRLFLFDEYKYVNSKKYIKIYNTLSERSKPKEKRSLNTVATEMKQLQAFFSSLEDSDEINKSPFRKLGKANRQLAVKEQYDEPVILRKEELLKIMETDVPDTLKATKDAFLLQCNFGQRISDFKKMTMANIAVNEDGIPYIHYLADKTKKQKHSEFVAPIMLYGLDIIKRTQFNMPILKYVSGQCGYNVKIKNLLKYCEIDRLCSVYDEEKEENTYLPLYELASSKLCRTTCNDLVRLQSTDDNASGLHSNGSKAIDRYISNWLRDVFPRWCSAFNQPVYKVDNELNVIE
jgi:hypothetical protein